MSEFVTEKIEQIFTRLYMRLTAKEAELGNLRMYDIRPYLADAEGAIKKLEVR